MAILDQRVHLTGEQVDAGHQSHCAIAFVFVIALDGGVGAGYWSQIGSRVADRLDPGFLVIGDDRDFVATGLARAAAARRTSTSR